jgi:methionyl-tRNA synthetase
VRQIAILTQPAMPEASARLLDILGVPNDTESRNFAALRTPIKPGRVLPAPAPVFPRYVEPTAA